MGAAVPDYRKRTFMNLLERKAELMKDDAARKFVDDCVKSYRECKMDPQDAVYKHFESDIEKLAARRDIPQANKELSVIGSFSILIDPVDLGKTFSLYDPKRIDRLAEVVKDEADLYKAIGLDLSSKLGAGPEFGKTLSYFLDGNAERCKIAIKTYLGGVSGDLPGIG